MGLSIAVGMFAGTNALAATTYTVTTLADTTGSCSGASCTTLRAAISTANGSAGNTINFTGLSGTITLTSALPAITQSVTITGPGASSLTISGNNAYQIFAINNSSATVAISGLTLAACNTANLGGAIYNGGMLTVTNSTFSGNSVQTFGGAIFSNGTLAVINSSFSGNSADGGGAIWNNGATLTVTNSSFSGNSAQSAGAIGFGLGSGTAIATNSTFSGNSADGGGAILLEFGSLTADNNIFTGNSATVGAGIDNDTGTLNASYNLFYQNFDAGGVEDDCNNCTSNTNVIKGSNPDLLPLGYYGGPTEALLPQPGSRAICAGNYADVPNDVTTDQRGFPLTNSTCSNGGVDVGAVQSDYVQVTTTADSGTGSLRAAINAAIGTNYGGDIDFSTSVTGTITLASALPTINQSTVIMGPGAGNLTISGNSAYQILNISSGAVTISGLTLVNGNSDLTSYGGGAIYNSGTLTVTNSIFSGNSGNSNSGGGAGGAIDSVGTLTVTNCTFSGNSALGGGALDTDGTTTVTNSTFSGNSGPLGGGAINNGGTMTVANSTFSGNSANSADGGFGGGAIESFGGTVTVINSTFSGNSTVGRGGAIYNFNGATLTADNNVFTGNSVANSYGGGGISAAGGTTNASYNLYYQNLDTGDAEDDCNSCTSNTNAITGSNPLLAALGSYGGTNQTLLPEPGSPAICAGSTALIPTGLTADQRGFNRTTTYNSTTCLDLGAVETDYTAVELSSSIYSAFENQAVNPAPVVTVTENGQNIGGVPITLGYSGTGSPTGLGPVTTVSGTGATFSSLTASSSAQGTLMVSLPITASGNTVQPAALSASATLNIHSTAQTITFVAASPLTYGNAPITLTATGGGSGNPVAFSLDSTSSSGAAMLTGANNSILTITGVGTIVIDANQAAGSGYVAAAQVQQSIVVNPASLTITASSPTVTYGAAIPTITPIFGTFLNGDTSAVLTKQPSCVTSYTTASAAGASPSTSCSGAVAANYTFNYINGSVTVNPAPTFVASGGGSSISIAPGATTGNTIPITVTPSNGFTGTVNLTCSISPVAASNPPTCALSPPSVTITGTTAQNSTLTISTTAALVGENRLKRLLWPSTGTALALVLLVGLPRRRGWLAMLGVLSLSIAIGAMGCGGSNGGSSGENTGTMAGSYTVTVTGSSGSITGTVGTIALTVQ